MIRRLLIIAYLVIGIVIADTHHYFAHVQGFRSGLSAALAVVLWPLVLAGVNLHIR